MARIDGFFKMMFDHNASDLHLLAGSQPILRINGSLERVDYPELDNDDLRKLLYEITPDRKIKMFEETGDVDFAYELPGTARFRANFFNQLRGMGAVFRLIPNQIKTLKQLNMPEVVGKFAKLNKGLVLVTGPTGSGKSTTLAAIVDSINRTRKDHIITIEDPIEFVHKPRLCSISHREVGSHTQSFSAALRGSLREDPDVILVGEMRDLETISLALEAASTGHLVFGTLHTQSAPKTVDRIIDVFPANEQEKIRITLSETLKGVIAQTLLRKKSGGRVAAMEILVVNYAVSNMIREGKTFQIYSVMQTQKKIGMQTLDESLLNLFHDGHISPELAYERANNKQSFVKLMKEVPEDIFA